MNTDYLEKQIQTTQQRLEVLSQNAQLCPVSPTLFSEALEEISLTLEELHVALEELHQQNLELSATRQQLELERKRYQELFEFAPDGYLVTNAQGTIQEVNRAAATLLNVDQKYLVGKPLSLFIAPADKYTFHTQLHHLMQLPRGECPTAILYRDWELSLQPRHGEPFPAEISISAVHSVEEKLEGLRWLIRDMTYRKQVESLRRQLVQEQELSELKSRFINTVSHEFRTPLNTIYVSAQLLARRNKALSEEKTSELFHRTDKAVRRIAHMLDDVLIFNKANAGKLEVKPALVDLKEFCSHVVEEQKFLAGDQHQIHFSCQGSYQSVCVDEKLLHQILCNLLSNALNYSPEGGDVYFELLCEEGQATFRIQDHGIGIPPEDQSRLFDPFHRAKNVSNLPGTGLGLAIVKRAVDLHSGTISVESEVGVGTTFTVTLPFKN